PNPTDVVSQVTSDAGGVVSGVTDTVTGTVQQVAPQTDPKHLVQKVVATVKGVVDRVLPTADGGTSQGTDGNSDGSRDPHTAHTPQTTHRHRNRASDSRARLHHIRSTSKLTKGASLAAPGKSTLVVRTAPANAQPQSLAGRIGRQIGRAAKQIAFPALLALLVGAFLILQNRIDRSDPKLIAWADNDHELVAFE
ncbi:MAG: hypothetical protein QOF16_1302, partial [Actinomycetota bacterium]|nr:hypothetical protein [Actinomycetota bacterium]